MLIVFLVKIALSALAYKFYLGFRSKFFGKERECVYVYMCVHTHVSVLQVSMVLI